MKINRILISSVSTFIIFILTYSIYFEYFSNESRLARALKHYKVHQYDLAFKEYMPYAKNGNIEAQCYVGSMYYLGKGTKKDFTEAFKWFKMAAEKGAGEAQFNLAMMYFDGEGVDKDENQAFIWLKEAADQGLPIAQVNLATCYISGFGTEKNLSRGVELLQKASLQNYPDASTRLGVIYYNGAGVKQSYEEAFKFFYKAAKHKRCESQYFIGSMYIEGKGVGKDLKEGRKWIYLSAKNGFDIAEIYIGFLFLSQGKNVLANKMLDKVLQKKIFLGLHFPDSRGEGERFIKCPTLSDFENAWQVWGDKNTPCSETASTILPLQVTMRVLGQPNNPTAPQLIPSYIGQKILSPDQQTDNAENNKMEDWVYWADDLVKSPSSTPKDAEERGQTPAKD